MSETDIKKCIDFIHKNADEVKKTERTSTSWALPTEIAEAIYNEIIEKNAPVTIPLAGFNKQFGWKETSARTSFLTRKLNEALPVDNQTWKVGTANKKEFYVFSIIDIEEE